MEEMKVDVVVAAPSFRSGQLDVFDRHHLAITQMQHHRSYRRLLRRMPRNETRGLLAVALNLMQTSSTAAEVIF